MVGIHLATSKRKGCYPLSFEQLQQTQTAVQKQVTVAVAAAEDLLVLEAVRRAREEQLCDFLLYGDRHKLFDTLEEHTPELLKDDHVTCVHTSDEVIACQQAVRAVRQNEANVLMKGNVPTSTILKAVLNKEYGLRSGKLLSHVAIFEVPGYDKFLYITDAGMNIAPTLEEKQHILQNAVSIAHKMGVELPTVAPLAAVEVVNPNMSASTDAALLTQMNRRGQIKGCIVDGPLALDNAINQKAAEKKGIHSEVAGNADILLVPTVESGNILYKSLIYFAGAKVGAVIAGAKAPIVLTSRSDSSESKWNSLLVAIKTAEDML